jgi:Arc/MetJ-type ribon-helix-helix transcriptional regulator
MTTINVSLPDKLKEEAEALIDLGLYVSFSDIVRDSLRGIIAKSKYDLLYEDAKKDIKEGRAVILKSEKDIDNFFKKL